MFFLWPQIKAWCRGWRRWRRSRRRGARYRPRDRKRNRLNLWRPRRLCGPTTPRSVICATWAASARLCCTSIRAARPRAAWLVGDSTPPIVVFVINLALAATVVAVFSARMAAGEEIGWRGYMLTRLIDASVPRPVLVSGVIWGLWHVPLILGGVYLPGPPPILSALFWIVVATSASFVFARLRLETGSIWPAIALHAAWNSIIQVAFDPASTGPGATLWVGESGIIVMLTMIAAAVVFTRGRWPVRKFPEVSRDDVAARAAPRA